MSPLRSSIPLLVAVLAAGQALGAAPVVRHNCDLEISTQPRPCGGDVDITRSTSIYFELVVPIIGHYPANGVDPDTVVLTITPAAGPTETVFGPGQVWSSGWSGRAYPGVFSGSNWVFGFESIPDSPLAPTTAYALEVTGRTFFGDEVDPSTSTWSFTTRRDLSSASIDLHVDVAGPTVTWTGRWYAGTAKVNFDTSRLYDQEAVYGLMDEVRDAHPDFMLQHRDAGWAGDYYRSTIFDGNPNIVRELETRRITEFRNTGGVTRLTLTDIVEHELYGIPPGRPLSEDFTVGEQVLVCDADQSEVHEIVAIDEGKGAIDVTQLLAPLNEWNPGNPGSAPADEPDVPDHFTHPLAALRKYENPGTPVYYWTRVDDELDQHVAHGRRPLVRINDTPVDLCETGLPANTSGGACHNVPKDWVEWDAFVYAVVDHLITRYGSGTASWYFSIGNENTISTFWRNRFNEFFEYYDVTSNAMLRAFEDHGLDSAGVLVGGVEDAPVGNRHLDEMLYHCSPTVANPGGGFVEENLVCADSRFASLLSARVGALCAANGNRGCPMDFYSIHPYRHAREAHEMLRWSWDQVRGIDPAYFTPYRVNSHEAGPEWQPQPDPAAKNVFAASGFFPTWAGDLFQRLLADAMADPARAAGESTITTWPYNYNFAQGTQSVASVMRIDQDGDGTQDGVDAVGNTYFRFVELISRMSNELADIGAVADAGARVGGWRSVESHGDNILLYAHDRLDPDGREELGWEVRLHLSGLRFPEVDVTEYRIDREHGPRAAYDALPKRGAEGVYLPAELADLEAADALAPLGPSTRHPVVGGTLELTTFVQGQGVTFLQISEVDADGDGIFPPEDNCPAIGNPDQADADGDGAGDPCDCAPGDPGAFSQPAEVSGLLLAGTPVTTLSWGDQSASAGTGTVYDMAGGLLGDLRSTGAFDAATCLDAGLTGPATSDGRAPPAGEGYYFLPRARNVCGSGTYGPDRASLDTASPCP